jgi:hypothetical protein
MNIKLILNKKYPDTEWVLIDNDYDKLTWLDSSSKPTKEMLENLWIEVQQEEKAEAQAKQAKLDSAKAKLAALGLDEEEIAAIVGGI